MIRGTLKELSTIVSELISDVERSYEAMQDALEHLYNERDSKAEDDPALDALIEKLENATGE